MKYFSECENLLEIKSLYRKLAKQYHPDVCGYDSTGIMQEINSEYKKALLNPNIEKNEGFDIDAEILNAENYSNALSLVIKLKGINIELCGSWLWISGNTYPYRKELLNSGFTFAPIKKVWYFRDVQYKARFNKNSISLNQIRRKYGSKKIEGEDTWNAYLSK